MRLLVLGCQFYGFVQVYKRSLDLIQLDARFSPIHEGFGNSVIIVNAPRKFDFGPLIVFLVETDDSEGIMSEPESRSDEFLLSSQV